MLWNQTFPAFNEQLGKFSHLFMSTQRVDSFSNTCFLNYMQAEVKKITLDLKKRNNLQANLRICNRLTERMSTVISISLSLCKVFRTWEESAHMNSAASNTRSKPRLGPIKKKQQKVKKRDKPNKEVLTLKPRGC